MVNTTYPKPIREWMGRTIRTEVPETPGTRISDVANLTPEMETYHLTRGRYPLPQQPGTPRGPSEIPPWGIRNHP